MATSIRVREKSAWKTLQIPSDLRNYEEFDGLVEIQELTDYELLSHEDDQDSGGSLEFSLPKRRKRKRKNSKETDWTVSVEAEVETKAKKRTEHVDDSVSYERSDKEKRLKNTKAGFLKAKRKNPVNIVNNSLEVTSELCDESNENASPDFVQTDQKKKLSKKKDKKQKKSSDKTEIVKNKSSVLMETQAELKRQASDVSQNSRNKSRKNEHTQRPGVEKVIVTCANDDGETGVTSRKNKDLDMSQWKNLYVPDELLRSLQEMGFDAPTMIQSMALPSAIRDRKDILGAAETGSGKTLAFGIPVLTRILNSRQAEDANIEESEEKTDRAAPMALILEPTRELAIQVKKHLIALAMYTDIKFATVVGGMSIEKQRRVLGKKPHVIIATPGRLWQLIEEGNEHVSQVDRVICLVVDEADRMVEKGHYEELTKLLEMINTSPRQVKNRQTFVMSATLTVDVGAPKRVKNKMKKKIKEEDKLKMLTERICARSKPKVIDLTPKEKVAQTLTELRVNCKADEKDFYLYYFLSHHPGRTLVFANSKDCVRRLVALFTLLQCSPLPLHADMHQRQRLKNLDRFAENKQGLLLASDVAARGLDIPNVDYVVHYQVPRTVENYVHRSGRTARASNLGLSVMFVAPEDARDYRKIMNNIRNGEELPLLPVEMELFPAVKQRVLLAREIDVREYRMKKKKLRKNFFTKAAQEMDMIIDDADFTEDMEESVELAQQRQQLQTMKSQLNSIIQGPLQPAYMTKYPTKSGQLLFRKAFNLHHLGH